MKAELIPISILTYFIFFTSYIFAQVPLNGFLRFQEFETTSGYEEIFPADYTGDGFRGIIAYNTDDRKYSALTYDGRSKKFINSQKFSAFSFTKIKSSDNKERDGKRFLFVSRRERTVGYFTFSRNGSAIINAKHKFDSYPNDIDIADINNDRRMEILVSGPSFIGLSVLSESKGRLIENNFGGNRSFSYSAFIDLDYDDYNDIAAFDLSSNSINLFYNDRVNSFSEQRSIKLDGTISSFKISDVNLDGFSDFVFLKNNNLEILLGDSVSTFKKKIGVHSQYKVDKYSIFDFNGDGYNDFAFLNFEHGILSIAFAENAFKFYEPVVYFQRKGIVDLNSYVDRGGRKLVVLDKNGKIYLIDKVTGFYEDTSFAAGFYPDLIGAFDYLNDGAPDFYVTDNSKNQLGIFLSARKNLFDKFYSVQLSQKHSNITVDDSDALEKIFYCYSTGSRLIEILRINFSNNEIKRRVLYADKPIDDFKLEDEKSKRRKAISLLLNDRGKLFYQSFEFRDIRYLKSALDSIALNVGASVISQNPGNEIFFFTRYDNTVYLNKTSLTSGKKELINISSFNLSPGKRFNIGLTYIPGKLATEGELLSLLSIDGNTSLTVYKRGSENTISINDFIFSIPIKHYKSKTGNVLYLFDKNSGRLKRILPGNIFSNSTVEDVFESKTINSYIVAPINEKKDILIYTDYGSNLINFKTIQ